jgi:hypothetical protein
VETVHQETLSVLLLNELKKEHDEVQLQRQRLDLLEHRLNDLTERRNVSATEPNNLQGGWVQWGRPPTRSLGHLSKRRVS